MERKSGRIEKKMMVLLCVPILHSEAENKNAKVFEIGTWVIFLSSFKLVEGYLLLRNNGGTMQL